MSCWEEVLGTPGTVPCLTARFLLDKERAAVEKQQFSREHSLQTLGERVAKIAHDLRNSLASVELFASLVERRVCEDPEHQKVAPQLLRSIRSLEQLVNNLSTSANPRKTKDGNGRAESSLRSNRTLVSAPDSESTDCRESCDRAGGRSPHG